MHMSRVLLYELESDISKSSSSGQNTVRKTPVGKRGFSGIPGLIPRRPETTPEPDAFSEPGFSKPALPSSLPACLEGKLLARLVWTLQQTRAGRTALYHDGWSSIQPTRNKISWLWTWNRLSHWLVAPFPVVLATLSIQWFQWSQWSQWNEMVAG